MSEKIDVVKRKVLKQVRNEYFDHFTIACHYYNDFMYHNKFELYEDTLTYIAFVMKDLKQTFEALDSISDLVESFDLENQPFKTKSERLILDNHYFNQDMHQLYQELETMFYAVKVKGAMTDDEN